MAEKPTAVKRFSLGCKIFEQFGDTAKHSPGLFIPGVIRLSFITDALSFPFPLLKPSLLFACLYSGLMPAVLLYQPPFLAFRPNTTGFLFSGLFWSVCSFVRSMPQRRCKLSSTKKYKLFETHRTPFILTWIECSLLTKENPNLHPTERVTAVKTNKTIYFKNMRNKCTFLLENSSTTDCKEKQGKIVMIWKVYFSFLGRIVIFRICLRIQRKSCIQTKASNYFAERLGEVSCIRIILATKRCLLRQMKILFTLNLRGNPFTWRSMLLSQEDIFMQITL